MRISSVLAVLVLLTAACSGGPSATATLPTRATPAATPSATVAPTSAPTVAPTAAPTLAPTLPPASPASTPIGRFGADEILFFDDMSNELSGFGRGTGEGGTAAYVDDTLQLTLSQNGAFLWSRRTTTPGWAVMHVEGRFSPAPGETGYYGLMCGADGDEFLAAVASTEGAWILAHIVNNDVTVLESDLDAGLALAPGQEATLALDCAGTATGSQRIQFYVDGQPAGDHEAAEGLATFDRVGAYGEASSDAFIVRVDDVLAAGGTGD